MNLRAERIFALANQINDLEERAAAKRRELSRLLSENPPRPVRARYVPRNGLRAQILDLLAKKGPLRAIDAAEALHPAPHATKLDAFKHRTVVQTMLCKMATDGLLERPARGVYQLPKTQSSVSQAEMLAQGIGYVIHTDPISVKLTD